MDEPKAVVRDFWNAAACGEVYAQGSTLEDQFRSHAEARYRLEPYIVPFARFPDGRDKDVLEIGVGLGADHVEWARVRPKSLAGVDFTPEAIRRTHQRLDIYGLHSTLQIADAEAMPFSEASFDLVYSWGVLHHTPDTLQAIREVYRVLRPGGVARIMVYHRPSVVGYLLWLRYGLAAGKPRRTLKDIYARHLESPGTKGFTKKEGLELLTQAGFGKCTVWPIISFGDLLEGEVGQQHGGGVLRVTKKVWPRWLIRRMNGLGLGLLIVAEKSPTAT